MKVKRRLKVIQQIFNNISLLWTWFSPFVLVIILQHFEVNKNQTQVFRWLVT